MRKFNLGYALEAYSGEPVNTFASDEPIEFICKGLETAVESFEAMQSMVFTKNAIAASLESRVPVISTEGLGQAIKDFFSRIWNWIKELFSGTKKERASFDFSLDIIAQTQKDLLAVQAQSEDKLKAMVDESGIDFDKLQKDLDLVTSAGKIKKLSEGNPDFRAAVVEAGIANKLTAPIYLSTFGMVGGKKAGSNVSGVTKSFIAAIASLNTATKVIATKGSDGMEEAMPHLSDYSNHMEAAIEGIVGKSADLKDIISKETQDSIDGAAAAADSGDVKLVSTFLKTMTRAVTRPGTYSADKVADALEKLYSHQKNPGKTGPADFIGEALNSGWDELIGAEDKLRRGLDTSTKHLERAASKHEDAQSLIMEIGNGIGMASTMIGIHKRNLKISSKVHVKCCDLAMAATLSELLAK